MHTRSIKRWKVSGEAGILYFVCAFEKPLNTLSQYILSMHSPSTLSQTVYRKRCVQQPGRMKINVWVSG